MTETRELLKNGSKSLVEIKIDGEIKKYVVCSDYNPSKEYGSQWNWGTYFDVWGDNTAEMMQKAGALYLYGIDEAEYNNALKKYERADEIANTVIGALVDHLDENDVIRVLKEDAELTYAEANHYDVADIIYPKKYRIVEATIERTQRAKLKIVMPQSEDDWKVGDYLDYIDDYDLDDIDEDDWDVIETDLVVDDITKEEFNSDYYDEVWNAGSIDSM